MHQENLRKGNTMCLLIIQPENSKRLSDEWLADFYASNSDGIGVMYAENNKLVVKKAVPKNLKAYIKFYRKHIEGKKCAWHSRFTTHGDTDMNNCHPYQVFSEEDGYPLWLMHNGVLSTGNAKDTSKSDTWHYINDIIRPALAGRPQDFTADWFQKLIEDHIGSSNKFVMMDALGNTQVFNKDSGVMWGNVWMSNTYAWDAAKAGVTKPYYGGGYKGYGYGGGYGYGSKGYWDDDYYEPVGKKQPAVTAKPVVDYEDSMEFQYAELFMDMLNEREYWESYANLSHQELSAYYVEDPEAAEHLLIALEDGSISDVDILEFFDTISYNKSFGYHQDTEDRLGAAA